MASKVQDLSVTNKQLSIKTIEGSVFLFYNCNPDQVVGADASTITVDNVAGNVYILHTTHLEKHIPMPVSVRGSRMTVASNVVFKEGIVVVQNVESDLVRVHSNNSSAQAVKIRHVSGNVISEGGVPVNVRISEWDGKFTVSLPSTTELAQIMEKAASA
ncbi:hypothetical protein HYQ44_006677 [Verticillium longisporum]|nr:hypothetical protein HYQ44_006677 [Verticillium longisporum]